MNGFPVAQSEQVDPQSLIVLGAWIAFAVILCATVILVTSWWRSKRK